MTLLHETFDFGERPGFLDVERSDFRAELLPGLDHCAGIFQGLG